ncbi:hypothetical protein EN873_28605 [bacterium M00.F.Ca.ET.230.01.1.1]|nr:hypothetical protein EN873_28605 [bacterium M00.F.Ca.ET.230.01.1.1]
MTNEQHWENLRASEAESWEDLRPLLEDVHDLQSFVRFIDGLRRDREDANRREALKPAGPYSSGWNGWENGSIASFLESAVAWFEDNRRGDPAFLADENPWKAAARIIYAGKYYE